MLWQDLIEKINKSGKITTKITTKPNKKWMVKWILGKLPETADINIYTFFVLNDKTIFRKNLKRGISHFLKSTVPEQQLDQLLPKCN